jgi:serine kinase of HPr protein (carbohydrate metabolism regulator)
VSTQPTIHASCVLAGATAILIRGDSGSGKSRLALALLQAGARGDLPFARLVGDDRIRLEAKAGRLLARPAKELAGLIEVRGVGIQKVDYEPVAVVGLVVDLGGAPDRLPSPEAQETQLEGVTLPRLAAPAGAELLPMVLEALRGRPGHI